MPRLHPEPDPFIYVVKSGENAHGSTELSPRAFTRSRVGQNMAGDDLAFFLGTENGLNFFHGMDFDF